MLNNTIRLSLSCLIITLLLFMNRGFSQVLTQNLKPDIGEEATGFSFYAVYDNLVDTKTHNLLLSTAEMSGDGSKIIFSGHDADSDERIINSINTDGSDLTSIPFPEDLWNVMQLLINQDGSIAYVHDNCRIYKIVGSSIYKIYDSHDNSELEGFSQIRITSDGLTLYIRKSESYQRGSIWRMDNSGGAIIKLFEYKDVIRDGGTGSGITNFDISADGEVIAFILRGYHDLESKFHTKFEVFIKVGPAYDQLTDDYENIIKGNIKISGNGNKIVFTSASPENCWYTINRDGSNKKAIDERNFDVVGPSIDYEGTTIFYRDDGTNGGRTANTNGLWLLDMFSSIYNNTLNVYSGLSMSDDGTRISFISRSGYDYYALYYGYINKKNALTDASEIISMGFKPAYLSTDPGSAIVVAAELNDPQGIDDIEYTSTEVLIDGIRKSPGSAEVPVCFHDPINDEAEPPDLTAHDGLFCTEGGCGPAIDEFSSITVRIGAADKSKNITIADTVLFIGTEPVDVSDNSVPDKFQLFQNYPNPFNSSTVIKYSLPINENRKSKNVKLILYDILGRELKTLVNQKQKPGNHEITFDGNDLNSGIYFYRLYGGNSSLVRKMIFLK